MCVIRVSVCAVELLSCIKGQKREESRHEVGSGNFCLLVLFRGRQRNVPERMMRLQELLRCSLFFLIKFLIGAIAY